MFENYKIKKITKNLGSIEERQDCIICTIDNNKLDDICRDGLLILDVEKLKRNYGIYKKVIFKIDNYNFRDGLFLITDASISFSNCKFHNDIFVKTAKDLVFTDNKYMNTTNTYRHSDRFMDISNTDKVTFMNETIDNYTAFVDVGIKIKADKIEFINTQVFNDEISSINLETKKLELTNSRIDGYSACIKTPSFVTDDKSSISPHKSIIIDTDTELDTNSFDSDQIIVNGIKILAKTKRTLILK